MPKVRWDPSDRKPPNAAVLEAEIRRVAPGAEVKLTLDDDEWLVRALLPAAMCGRGAAFTARDVSAAVAEVLADHDVPARISSRRTT